MTNDKSQMTDGAARIETANARELIRLRKASGATGSEQQTNRSSEIIRGKMNTD
jgi:hypothetical protein